MNKQTEALKMAVEALEEWHNLYVILPDANMKKINFSKSIQACKEALLVPTDTEQPAQEPVACPYPCGWDNLYKITTGKGAYLVTHFDADNPMPYSYWQEISSMVDTARTMVKWAMQLKTHPAPSNGMDKPLFARIVPWQGLSDDEIEKAEFYDEDFHRGARWAEQILKEKNHG